MSPSTPTIVGHAAAPAAPKITFSLVDTSTEPGFPTTVTDDFTILLDNAVSGGEGTATYLRRMLAFATFAAYLKGAGAEAFTTADGPRGSRLTAATDGTTVMKITVALNDDLAERDLNGIPVRGLASVQVATTRPLEIIKYAEFGISLAELPAGLAVTSALMDALFTPLLSRLTSFVQSTIEAWLESDVGELEGVADALADTAGDIAGTIAEETSEIVLEEAVVAEISLDLAAIAPPLAALGALLAIPLLIQLLQKTFQVHFELTNFTEYDFTWTIEYIYNGAMTSRPASPTIPKMDRATDAWGDKTDVLVAYQADFFSINSSGFEGTGYALKLATPDLPGEDIAVVLSVPWALDNTIWAGEPPADGDWQALFSSRGGGGGPLSVNHGTRHLYVDMGLDAASGHQDSYHCALRVRPIPPTEQNVHQPQ